MGWYDEHLFEFDTADDPMSVPDPGFYDVLAK